MFIIIFYKTSFTQNYIQFDILMNINKPIQTKFQIVEKTSINHDCYIYKFKFVGESFQLKIGEHFRIIETVKTIQHPQGQTIMRKYTPISPCSEHDIVEVLFKIYRASPTFPQGGKLTQHIQSLQVGAQLNIQGPFGRFNYIQSGKITIDGQPHQINKIFFIAGGSGITPCYQTIMEIAKMKDQTIELILLFANKQEHDIVLRKELEALGNRLKLHFIVDKADQNWKHFTGYVTQHILNQICPLDQKDTLYVHCGPPPMNRLIRELFAQSYPQSKIFKF